MVKKQQMRWTPEGAHLLLQARTRTLNGELAATFRVWYPAFASEDLELLAEPATRSRVAPGLEQSPDSSGHRR